jgi:hypothetical protein
MYIIFNLKILLVSVTNRVSFFNLVVVARLLNNILL